MQSPFADPLAGLVEISLQILDEAELVALQVGHHHDDAFAGIVVSLAGPTAAKSFHLPTSVVDVVHLDCHLSN